MIRNPCVALAPDQCVQTALRSAPGASSEHAAEASRAAGAWRRDGAPAALGGRSPLRRTDGLRYARLTQVAHLAGARPAAGWGSSSTSGWKSCVSLQKPTRRTSIPTRLEIPEPPWGPGRPGNPQMGRRGQGEAVFKTLQP